MVPSMLLQPLVENSIKHGLSSKIEGGSIFLRSRLTDSKLIIEVEDDGVGMGAAQSAGKAHRTGRDRHRHGKRGGAIESLIRRNGAHDHRQPRRQGNSDPFAAAGAAERRRDSGRASTKNVPARAGKTLHIAERSCEAQNLDCATARLALAISCKRLSSLSNSIA